MHKYAGIFVNAVVPASAGASGKDREPPRAVDILYTVRVSECSRCRGGRAARIFDFSRRTVSTMLFERSKKPFWKCNADYPDGLLGSRPPYGTSG